VTKGRNQLQSGVFKVWPASGYAAGQGFFVEKDMNRRWDVRVRWLPLIVLLCALFGLTVGGAEPSGKEPPRDFPQAKGMPGGGQGIMDRLGPFVDRGIADLSLTVREQVDFLLTPALLVQEAVSDDVVLTYPEE